jgi:hypothetical protein
MMICQLCAVNEAIYSTTDLQIERIMKVLEVKTKASGKYNGVCKECVNTMEKFYMLKAKSEMYGKILRDFEGTEVIVLE